MAGFTVSLNQSQVDEVKLLLANVKNGAEQSMRIALNLGLDTAVSLSAKGINEKTTLTQSKAKEFFDTTRATNASLSAVLRIRGERKIPLIDFTNSALGTGGVSVKVWRDESPVKYRHAFYATMKSGHRGIFQRDIKSPQYGPRAANNRWGLTWLPIDELVGPDVATVYEKTPGLAERVEEESSRRAIEELDRQVDRLLGI